MVFNVQLIFFQPPTVTNLPHIVELLETTRSALPLYQIDVVDLTNDPMCCTMPFSIPYSYNFELRTINNSGMCNEFKYKHKYYKN